jgi:LPXTG-motif cell wall-anchored protein
MGESSNVVAVVAFAFLAALLYMFAVKKNKEKIS